MSSITTPYPSIDKLRDARSDLKARLAAMHDTWERRWVTNPDWLPSQHDCDLADRLEAAIAECDAEIGAAL